MAEREAREWRRGDHRISTDVEMLDVGFLHGFLTTAYWSPAISRQTVERSIQHSLCFGLYEGDQQIGFARVVTDRTSFAYLADVFISESHRGRGLGTWLIETILGHPELQGLGRWTLATRDAHELYRRFGFGPLADPSRFMEKRDRSEAGDSPLPDHRTPEVRSALGAGA